MLQGEGPTLRILRQQLQIACLHPASLAEVQDGVDLLAAAGASRAATILSNILVLSHGVETVAPLRHDSVTAAIDELTGLMAIRPAEGSSPFRPERRGAAQAPEPAAMTVRPPPQCDDLKAWTQRLVDTLRADGSARCYDDLRRLLDFLDDRLPIDPAMEPSLSQSTDVEQLVAKLSAVLLRRFVSATFDVARAPFGSSELLHASMRLHPATLGPCFRNTASLVESGSDLLDLIESAAGKIAVAASEREDLVDRFVVLLAAWLPSWLGESLAGAAADAGRVTVVSALSAAALRRPKSECDRSLFWTLRDACLDLGQLDRARDVQARLVVFWPEHEVEAMVLGELEASAGDRAQAAALFRTILNKDPRNSQARARWRAAMAGDFTPFMIARGLGSTSVRTMRRRAARDRRSARRCWHDGLSEARDDGRLDRPVGA